MSDLARRFQKALHRLNTQLGQWLTPALPEPLTPGQVLLLYAVQQSQACTVSSLAESMAVKPSAITVMLDRLEQHGFVERQRDQRDRRVVHVHLTAAGQAALRRVTALHADAVGRCLAQLGEQAEPFVQTLERLAQAASELALATPFKEES
ncbi:MAG: MarR family transcriptional regulator [Alicyclobacillus sp.]|nr:MarR family transcriptional regulator [Alicyclobacillus sp.]